MRQKLVLLTGIGLLAVPVAARAVVSQPAGSLEAPARASGLGVRLARLPDGRVRETFLADGTALTLRLSWSALKWGSAEVRVEDRPLVADAAYVLDYENGTCRLLQPLPAGSVVEVTYRLVPLLSLPFSVAGEVPFLAPARPGGSAVRDALALTLARRQRTRPSLKLPAGLGTSLAIAPPPDVRQQLATGLRLTESTEQLGDRTGNGKVSYFRADAFDPTASAAAREEFNSQLNFRPTPTSRLLVSNYFSRESLFTEDYEENERRKIQFEQTWDRSSAALMWERRRADGYGVANALDALSLTLTRSVTSTLSAEGMLSYRDSLYMGRESQSLLSLRQLLGGFAEARGDLLYRRSEFWGNTLESGLTLAAHPHDSSEFQVSFRRSDSEQYGRYQRLAASAEAEVTSRVQVHGELSQRSTGTAGNIFTYGVGLTAQPTTRTLLETAFSESTGQVTGRDRSQSVRLSVDPSSAFRLQLGFDRLDSSDNGLSQNAMWIVTVGGKRYVKFEGYSGLYALQQDGDYRDDLYRLEVRPVPALAFSGSLREIQEADNSRSLAGVGASLKLVRGVDVSATYRQPRGPNDTELSVFGRDFRLSLAPVSGFRVYGQYSERPEDQRGVLLDQTNRSIGVETMLGSFSVQGAVTSLYDPLAPTAGRQLDLLASLRLGTGTRLYGGLRTLDSPLADESGRSRIYRLGVSQTAGESFFMLLEGQFGWMIDDGGARTWSLEDTRAQARLGLRF